MKNPPADRIPGTKTIFRKDNGEEIAVAALGFIAGDTEKLSRFLSLSGLGPHNLRAAAADPGFLAAVLDHIMSDERLLVEFAAAERISPESVVAARRALGGPPPDDP